MDVRRALDSLRVDPNVRGPDHDFAAVAHAEAAHVLDPLLLRIDMDRDADPVSGRVWAGDGMGRGFAGWTELFTALQEAVLADRASRHPGTGSPEADMS